jgi:hypothetical protein
LRVSELCFLKDDGYLTHNQRPRHRLWNSRSQETIGELQRGRLPHRNRPAVRGIGNDLSPTSACK